jgi:hypothetical protein
VENQCGEQAFFQGVREMSSEVMQKSVDLLCFLTCAIEQFRAAVAELTMPQPNAARETEPR